MGAGKWHQTPAGRRRDRQAKQFGDAVWNLAFGKPKRRKKSGCYIATAVYGSYDCPQVWTLRRYRDDMLAQSWYGRLFINLYYSVSPTIVKWFGDTQWFKKMWETRLNGMVERLNKKGVSDTPYQDKEW